MDMELIETIAHQLDVGAQLLFAHDSVRARLALIATDNAVELLFYSHAEDALHSRQTANASEPPLKLLKEALGERFDPKIKYAWFTRLIDEDEAQFIREAHHSRCQAYHTGRVDDDILWDLTHVYHDVACSILSRARPRGLLMRSDRAYGEIYPTIAKYLGETAPLGLTPADFARLSSSLAVGKPKASGTLAAKLRSHMLKRLARIREGVGVLFKAGRCGSKFRSLNHLLFDLQIWDRFYSYAPEGSFTVVCRDDGTCEIDPSQRESHAQAIAATRNWKPNVTEKTLIAWEKQIKRLDEGLPPGRVLQMYQTLSSKMLSFQRIVERQWGWLEMSLEAQRGK